MAAQDRRADPRARPADPRSAPSPVERPRRSLLPAGAAGRHRHGPRHPRHDLRAMRGDVSRGRSGGGEVARRDRVRNRHRSPERQWPPWVHARLRGHDRHGRPHPGRPRDGAAREARGHRRHALLRHPQPHRLASFAGDTIQPRQCAAGTARESGVRHRRQTPRRVRPAARRLGLSHAAAARGEAGARCARAHGRGRPRRRPDRHRPVPGQARRGLPGVEEADAGARIASQRRG